jgi:hypothetical protein
MTKGRRVSQMERAAPALLIYNSDVSVYRCLNLETITAENENENPSITLSINPRALSFCFKYLLPVESPHCRLHIYFSRKHPLTFQVNEINSLLSPELSTKREFFIMVMHYCAIIPVSFLLSETLIPRSEVA